MDVQAQFAERQKRVNDALAVKEPDRVPIAPKMGLYYCHAYNVSIYDVMVDVRNSLPAVEAFLNDFQPDVAWSPFVYNIPALEALGTNFIRWPGATHKLPLDTHFQILDGCYVHDDEFAEFAKDPTHFIMTKALPRKHENLKGLAKLDFRNAIEFSQFIGMVAFTDPDVKVAIDAMTRCGEAMAAWLAGSAEIGAYITGRGFPLGPGAAQTISYDMFADNYRGFLQTAMDVIERPDELEAILDKFIDISVECAVGSCKATGMTSMLIPLHGGVDEFISPANYRRFYWKGLNALMTALSENDILPYVFCEGNYNSRLENLAEFAGPNAAFMFEKVDMKKAKAILGKKHCLCGNFPAAMLAFGKPEQITEEVKKLLDICAPGGGFIMDTSIECTSAQPR
ncbi:MAG: hypothetical protein LBH09_07710, partial [Peptococcaceae bacterium]|nr:hypothetical protein [Peptococcaceae bacterium]